MKKFIVPVVILALAAAFIPFKQEDTLKLNAPFLKTYNDLLHAGNWVKWLPLLLHDNAAANGKIVSSGSQNKFSIRSGGAVVNVESKGGTFYISEDSSGKVKHYEYTLMPAKNLNITLLTVAKKGTFWNYLSSLSGPGLAAEAHATAFKNYLETDSLYYGEHIYKTRVPEKNLVVIKRSVVKSQQFAQAQLMLKALKQYVKQNGALQKAPVIAQFWNKTADSVQINIGLFVDKRLKAMGEISVVTMPYGGPLYYVKYNGPFKNRLKVYTGVEQYFKDRMYQQAIQPFETYLNDQLPASENDTVRIEVNFTSFI